MMYAFALMLKICTGAEGCYDIQMDDAIYSVESGCESKRVELVSQTKSNKVKYRCKKVAITSQMVIR